MPTFKNLNSALKHVQKIVNETLLNEVTNAVKVAEIEHVMDDVYTRPTSGAYKRRYADGGLGDVNNLKESLASDGVLVVSNETPFNPYLNGVDASGGLSLNSGNALDGLVNFGDGWHDYYYDYSMCGPTNFIEKAVDDLKSSGEHVKAMKDGLQKRGLTVK